jgi:serine/threonine protein kinase
MESSLQREESLFSAALEITDPAAREAFLDRECGDDEPLRAAVEESLAAQAEAEEFFTRSTASLVPAKDVVTLSSALEDLDAETLGTSVGPYKLLQRLGEGGCGVVYLAEQEKPVRRRVALKVIKLGMDTKSVIARFEAEQHALAMMDHPSIARVLDAGVTDSGRPYFVMELVPGVKLTTYCDESELDIPQRLRLFVQVCHAIQHAHQKGIIHRDIKPSNILVSIHDGVAIPKVIDFGIAKAIEGRLTDQTLFTPSEHFIGTPAYMSPEQAQFSGLDVDTRSDIYSLGVLLYELLTGRTPFDQKALIASGLDEMRRTLRDCEPPAPSKKVEALRGDELIETAGHRQVEPSRLKSLLKDDLDWIVMKALEKDRQRRYETANGLASDVRRYLDNEPVIASPPSRLYRLQKLVSRNRVTFAAGGVVAISLVTFSVVTSWLLIKEREARRHAALAEQQKVGLQQEAEKLDQLRQTAEDRQKLLEAMTLFGQGKNDEADALLGRIVLPKPSADHAIMYRALGDWHAAEGRWPQALDRFAVLDQINRMASGDSTLDDLRYAPMLVKQHKLAEYARFRESLIARYAGTEDPIVAERVVKACLLSPANVELMRALSRYVQVSQESLEKADLKTANWPDINMAAWRAYTLSLMAYRTGNHELAIKWGQRSRGYDQQMQSRVTSVQVITAMAHARLGQADQAQAELAESGAIIENAFNQGVLNLPRFEGFWFDWVIAQIHLREAEDVIQ